MLCVIFLFGINYKSIIVKFNSVVNLDKFLCLFFFLLIFLEDFVVVVLLG